MKRNQIKIILATAAIFIVSGCSDEFLDIKPYAQESSESFYTNFNQLDYSATAAYGILCTRDIFDYYYFIGLGCASDDAETGGENTNDLPQFQRIDRLLHTSSEADIFSGLWGYYYKGIRMTNEFLDRVDEVSALENVDLTSNTPSANLYKQRIAEMKFLRAFYHFLGVQVFGGIPIVDHAIDPTEFRNPRNSIAEVLQFIETDLEAAIPVLKEKSELGADYGRASKGAAAALLAKVYLYESSYAKNYPNDERFTGCAENWAKALSNAELVINSGEYKLVGIDGERIPSWRSPANTSGVGGFRWMFTLDGDNCDESVFEIQNVLDGRGWTYTRGCYYTTFTTVRYYNNKSNPSADAVVGGWSFNLPTNYLIDAFGNQDSRETGLNSTSAAPELDPRFATTIGRQGDTVRVNDITDGVGWYPMSFSNLPTGTISRKYECSPEEYWNIRTNDNEGPMNMRYFRYADVVLIAAEAAMEAGNSSKALDYVNLVRTRARMSGETNFPKDLSQVSFEDIVHERRLELAMEGARFFDLVRWNLAEKFINGIELASLGDGFNVEFIKGKHDFFPIPNDEVQLSQGGLVQYPGW